MKTATIRDLRNEFARLSKWLEKGESVQIIKRGKPFARVVPESKPKSFLGATPSAVPLPPDLDDPPPMTWEAGKELVPISSLKQAGVVAITDDGHCVQDYE